MNLFEIVQNERCRRRTVNCEKKHLEALYLYSAETRIQTIHLQTVDKINAIRMLIYRRMLL